MFNQAGASCCLDATHDLGVRSEIESVCDFEMSPCSPSKSRTGNYLMQSSSPFDQHSEIEREKLRLCGEQSESAPPTLKPATCLNFKLGFPEPLPSIRLELGE